MSARTRTLVTILGALVGLAALAVLFPVKLPPIEAGPMTVIDLHIGGIEFPISNTMIVAWTVMLILFLVTYFSTRRMELIPSGLQNLVEALLETINGMVSDIAGERGKRFFPFVATLFVFVLLSNILGLLPGFGSIGMWEEHGGERVLVPLFRSPSADLNTTFALALVSVVMTQVFGIAALGLFGYVGKFINLGKLGQFVLALIGRRPRSGMAKLLAWGLVDFFVGIVELFSEMVKLITFSFRLFGNIFAGEVILIVMAYLFAQIMPLPFYALEIFVAFIQAFVFAILTLVFMSMATARHGGEEHAAH